MQSLQRKILPYNWLLNEIFYNIFQWDLFFFFVVAVDASRLFYKQ